MEVLLDTNFIISCLVKRIDFLGELEGMGFKVKVPREVLQELKDLKTKDKTVSKYEKSMIDVAFSLLEEKKVKKMKIGGKNVDEGLIAKGNEGYYIATLDRVIKNKIPNRVVISGATKSLVVERN